MLNENELATVNKIVKGFDNSVEVIADTKCITIVEKDITLNEVFTDKVKFIEEVRSLVKSSILNLKGEEKKIAVRNLIDLNNIKYNHLKKIVLDATEKGTFKDINKHIKMLDDFINLYTLDACSLKKSQSIKTYRDIIINCDTVLELQETLKDVYYMKQAENVKNNDYIIATIEEVAADKELFKNECDKDSSLYDLEVDEHLSRYKVLNRKFMYIA